MALRHTVGIEACFCATHQVRLPNGEIEPLHGHDWSVRVLCSARALDQNDMVVDFHRAQSVLNAVLAPLQHANLNHVPDFVHRNPTAETVAEWLLVRLRGGGLPGAYRVEITEAPGCVAICEWSDG